MSEQDIIETQVVDNDEYPQIPYADTENPGIASFNPDDFVVGENGHISATQKSGIPQYLGKIVGSGQGVSSLNWKLDSGSIKPTEQVKIGDYVMLTDAYLNFKPGDIFRITFVQVKGSVYTVKTSNTKLTSLGTIESGGKLYQHVIKYVPSSSPTISKYDGTDVSINGDSNLFFKLYSTKNTELTSEDINKLFTSTSYIPGVLYFVGSQNLRGAVAILGGSIKLVYGAVRNDSDKNAYTYMNAILGNDTFTDTVTEL